MRARGVIHKGRADPGDHIGKAFAAGGTMLGKVSLGQGAKIGDLGKGHAFLGAKVLFPEPRILCRIHSGPSVRPERCGGLATAQRRADDAMRHLRHQPLQRLPDLRIAQITGHIRPTAQAPAMHRGGVSNQQQFRGVRKRHFRAFQEERNMVCHVAMGKSILITGGARSGKSTLAEQMTLSLGRPAIYIATAQAHDGEMSDRITQHQARRDSDWRTIEAPMDLIGALRDSDGTDPRLVDCLTLWLTNLMLAEQDWEAATQALAQELSRQSAPVIFVTNEVGAGIVPENALARAFRDAAGIVNQRIATACDELWFCVAGHPLKVKPA